MMYVSIKHSIYICIYIKSDYIHKKSDYIHKKWLYPQKIIAKFKGGNENLSINKRNHYIKKAARINNFIK